MSDLTIGLNFDLDRDHTFLYQAIQETFEMGLTNAVTNSVGDLIAQTVTSDIGVSFFSEFYDFGSIKEFTGTTQYSEYMQRMRAVYAIEWSKAFKHSWLEVRRDPQKLTRSALALAYLFGRHKEKLIFELGVKGGFSGTHIDNVPFFSANHVTHDSNGVETVFSNYDTGTSPVWLLADLSDPSTLPFVFQSTEAPNVISITDPNDSVVRSNQYFEVIGRSSSNASQLFHQKVIASRKALTFDNLVDAYERLSSQHNRSGESLGIKPTHLITGTNHTKALKAMVKDTAVQGSPIIQLESSDFLAVRTTPYMNFTPPV